MLDYQSICLVSGRHLDLTSKDIIWEKLVNSFDKELIKYV